MKLKTFIECLLDEFYLINKVDKWLGSRLAKDY